MRRGSDDLVWQALKVKVHKRDQDKDRLLRILTVKEALLLQKLAPSKLLQKLDVAHIFAVSTHTEIMYWEANVVLLNRWSHDHLDNMRHPITGDPITKEEQREWWKRIARDQWKKLENQVPECREE